MRTDRTLVAAMLLASGLSACANAPAAFTDAGVEAIGQLADEVEDAELARGLHHFGIAR